MKSLHSSRYLILVSKTCYFELIVNQTVSLSERIITQVTKTLISPFCHICSNKILDNLGCCLEIVYFESV